MNDNKTNAHRLQQLEQLLRQTRSEMKEDFQRYGAQIDDISAQIKALQQALNEANPQVNDDLEAEQQNQTALTQDSDVNEAIIQNSTIQDWSEDDEFDLVDPGIVSQDKGTDKESVASSHLSNRFSRFFDTLWVSLSPLLNLLFGMFGNLFDRVLATYTHYQKQGKAPVFLMTVTGILAMVLGFGYLLQYSLTYLLSDTLKIVLGYAFSIAILSLGVYLYHSKKNMQDFASSIIALGLILNYVVTFFTGPQLGMVSETISFMLFSMMTLITYGCALYFDRKVIAVLTLIGGALTPLLINAQGWIDNSFVIYLLLLTVANLHLASKINWPLLAQLTFFTVLGMVEFMDVKASHGISPIVMAFTLQAFFWLFNSYFSFNKGLQLKPTFTRIELVLLVANAFYFMVSWYALPIVTAALAGWLLLDVVLLSGLCYWIRVFQSHAASFYSILIGSFIAMAAGVYLPVDASAVIWAGEALVLLALGLNYQHRWIRIESYFALLLVTAVALFNLYQQQYWQHLLSGHWQLTEQPGLLVNLSLIGLCLYACRRLLKNNVEKIEGYEHWIAYISYEAFTLWVVVALWSSAALLKQTSVSVVSFAFIFAAATIWCFARACLTQLQWRRVYVANSVFILMIIVWVMLMIVNYVFAESWLLSQQTLVIQFNLVALIAVSLLLLPWYRRLVCHRLAYCRLESQQQSKELLQATQLPRWAAMVHVFAVSTPLILTLLLLADSLVLNSLMFTAFHTIDMVIIGFGLWGAWALSGSNWLPLPKSLRLRERGLVYDSLSVAIAAFIFVIVGSHSVPLALVLGVPVMFVLFKWGMAKQRIFTRILAWCHALMPIAAIAAGALTTGTLQFSKQPWYAQLGWLELALIGWGLQWIYQKADMESAGMRIAKKCRTLFYLVVPLFFIPHVVRHYSELLPAAIAFSFLISWLMSSWLKRGLFYNQRNLLFVALLVSLGLDALAALNSQAAGQLQWSYLVNVLVSWALVLVVQGAVLHCAKGGFTQLQPQLSSRLYLFFIHFYGYVVLYLSYSFSQSLSWAGVILGAFYLLCSIYLSHSRFVQIQLSVIRLMAVVSWLVSFASAVNVLFISEIYGMGYPAATASIKLQQALALLVSTTLLAWISQHNTFIPRWLNGKKNVNYSDYALHGLIFVSYAVLIHAFIPQWIDVLLSVIWVVHAVVLLFLSMYPRYQHLLKLSVTFYAATAFKIILFDMRGLDMVDKVIAFMVIGAVLLIAAYQYDKLKQKLISSSADEG